MLLDDHLIGWHPHYTERLSPGAPGKDDEPGME